MGFPLARLLAAPAVRAAAVRARSRRPPCPRRLMPLGDSITWGVGSPSGNSYRGFLWNQLTADGHALDFVGSGRNGTMSDPDNEGHSGWRIDQIAGIADSVLARYRPNVVTLEIGTNDLNGNYQVPTATDRLPRAHRPDHPRRPRRDRPRRHRHRLHQRHRGGQPARVQRQAPRNRPGRAGRRQARTPGGHERADRRGPVRRPAPQRQRLPQDGGRLQRRGPGRGRGRLDQAAGLRGRQVHSGIAGKCLDVNGGNSANGTAAQIWCCNGTAAQQWSAHADGTLRALGKCLDATGRGTANGTQGRRSGTATAAATSMAALQRRLPQPASPAAAWTTPARPPPTARNWSCGTATAPTSSGPRCR